MLFELLKVDVVITIVKTANCVDLLLYCDANYVDLLLYCEKFKDYAIFELFGKWEK